MRRLFGCLLILGIAVVLMAPAVGQQPKDRPPPPRDAKDAKDAPPPRDDRPRDAPPKDRGPGDRGPLRFELGRVLPPFVAEQLELTADQKKEIAELEKEVKAKLDKILTADQKKKLETLGPPRGGPGDRPPPPDREPGRDRPPERERDRS
jgi:hypothetical protein